MGGLALVAAGAIEAALAGLRLTEPLRLRLEAAAIPSVAVALLVFTFEAPPPARGGGADMAVS